MDDAYLPIIVFLAVLITGFLIVCYHQRRRRRLILQQRQQNSQAMVPVPIVLMGSSSPAPAVGYVAPDHEVEFLYQATGQVVDKEVCKDLLIRFRGNLELSIECVQRFVPSDHASSPPRASSTTPLRGAEEICGPVLPPTPMAPGGPACSICMEALPTDAFVPCGHRCVCTVCAQNVLKAENKVCPICRALVSSSIHIYDCA